jgi:hypothetical protein
MIAVVSSCLAPSTESSHTGGRTNLSPEARLAQTGESVASLVRVGFEEIYLADNSESPPSAETIARLAPARVYHFGHFPYRNKGIAEVYLLLALTKHLPTDRPIMKLSGRYRASINLCAALGTQQVAGLLTKSARIENLSTRAYAVSDLQTFREFLEGSLNEIYAAPWRVVGPRSLLNFFRRNISSAPDPYLYRDPPVGLEIAAARWLARQRIPIARLDKIGVEGVLGGCGERISE